MIGYGRDAIGRFRMLPAHVVQHAIGMMNERRRHAFSALSARACLPSILCRRRRDVHDPAEEHPQAQKPLLLACLVRLALM